jgi:hypothetical protein
MRFLPVSPWRRAGIRTQGMSDDVEWFFENLLPEGRLRELIASRDRIDPKDTWALLIRHGQDTAGALSLIPDEIDHPDVQERLVPACAGSIAGQDQRVAHAQFAVDGVLGRHPNVAGRCSGEARLRIDAHGALFLPEGTAASTHIVKPENASADFPFCPANEFFCMRLRLNSRFLSQRWTFCTCLSRCTSLIGLIVSQPKRRVQHETRFDDFIRLICVRHWAFHLRRNTRAKAVWACTICLKW